MRTDYKQLIDKFKGEIVFCVASGPSLTQEDVDSLKGFKVVTANSSFKRAPWADIFYSNDWDWWKKYYSEAFALNPRGLWSGHPTATKLYPMIKCIPFDKKVRGLPPEPNKIGWYGNSGLAMTSLVDKTNPKVIGLLGYDMQETNGMSHWHGDHPEDIRKGFNFPMWIERAEELAEAFRKKGTTVINFSRQTSLTCFERGDLGDFLLTHKAVK